MHPIQQRLLKLSKQANLAKLSLREMARRIEMPGEAPQKVKHHLQQLEKKGFFSIDRRRGTMGRASSKPGWADGVLETKSKVFAIPIVGAANCGPATLYAEENFQGYLRVSSRLVNRSQPTGLYAIRAAGSSMNRADVDGQRIEDGDLVIVDGRRKSPSHGDIVVAIVENKATIKRFFDDRANGQIVLKADSTIDFDPIHLHPDEEFAISGKVVAVVKKPTPISGGK